MTTKNLIDSISTLDIVASKKDAKIILDFITSTIANTIQTGTDVKISGFGTFHKFAKTAKGQPTGAFAAKFRAAKALKDKVNA